MGTHHAPQQHHGLGGLVGRGALTAAAALALAGGGAGVAFAGDAPSGGDQDASQSQDHGDDCSCDGHDGRHDHDGRQDRDSWQDSDANSDSDSDSDDPGWMSFGSDDHDGRSSTKDCDRGDGGPGTRHGDAAPTRDGGQTHGSGRQTGSHAPTSENISQGAAQGGAKTVPISSGVMR
jgi:hypothetical protein